MENSGKIANEKTSYEKIPYLCAGGAQAGAGSVCVILLHGHHQLLPRAHTPVLLVPLFQCDTSAHGTELTPPGACSHPRVYSLPALKAGTKFTPNPAPPGRVTPAPKLGPNPLPAPSPVVPTSVPPGAVRVTKSISWYKPFNSLLFTSFFKTYKFLFNILKSEEPA